MPSYYLSVRNPGANQRREACECADLKSAMIEANGVARSLIHNQLRRNRDVSLHGSVDIENDQQQPLARIMLADLARQLS